MFKGRNIKLASVAGEPGAGGEQGWLTQGLRGRWTLWRELGATESYIQGVSSAAFLLRKSSLIAE